MKDIENESIWVRKNPKGFGKARNTVKVLGTTVDEDGDGLVWIEWGEEKEYGTFSSLYFLDTFEEKKPFFEANATYKFRASCSELRYFIVEIRNFKGERYAIAERTGSSSLPDRIVVLDEFTEFEEV